MRDSQSPSLNTAILWLLSYIEQQVTRSERSYMYWWGFNALHGWVVLDRNIPCNQAGQSGDLIFYVCPNLETFNCSRKDWDEPNFIYAPKYLKNLSETASIEFEMLKVKVEERLRTLLEEQSKADLEKKQLDAIENHQNFLKGKGLPYRGVLAGNHNKKHRLTHCYACKDSLDSEINSLCAACRWIICECGACGCGYEF